MISFCVNSTGRSRSIIPESRMMDADQGLQEAAFPPESANWALMWKFLKNAQGASSAAL